MENVLLTYSYLHQKKHNMRIILNILTNSKMFILIYSPKIAHVKQITQTNVSLFFHWLAIEFKRPYHKFYLTSVLFSRVSP
jgi:hypothetical protein